MTSTSVPDSQTATDPLLDLAEYAQQFEGWLAAAPPELTAVTTAIADYGARVAAMQVLMGRLFADGWARYGWPVGLGGHGGTIRHRAVMWEALSRYGVQGMALFEHLEVLAPTLAALGPPAFVRTVLPTFLAGQELWSQGFSEPEAGSDLASLRTTAKPVDGGYAINGRKIWTSWAPFATWCLVLTRTGTPDSRHRGLTAFIVDLRDAGVEVRGIEQANGTQELAEVTFDDVFVSADRIVGEVGGGWAVAMHILSHERGTFAWFRHCFLYEYLHHSLPLAGPTSDTALGNAVLDLAVVTAAGQTALQAHATETTLGPRAAFTKLLLCAAEQSVNDWILSADHDLAFDVELDDIAVRRQEYLFSRIVTVYGGSQQMQLETIAKQILRLP